MTKIRVQEDNSEYNFDLQTKELQCTHADTEFIEACCLDIGPRVECGCRGDDIVVCNNDECDGALEIDDIYNKLAGGGSDCE
jgi:hypothetical protein